MHVGKIHLRVSPIYINANVRIEIPMVMHNDDGQSRIGDIG